MDRSRQRGVAAVFVLVALVALLAVAGLALDASHLGRNKARLQSTVDAAALAAAKVLDQTGDTADATAAAQALFASNAADFPALQRVIGQVGVNVEYSNTLVPFAPGTLPPRYVRVRATNFVADASLTRVVGLDELTTRASAVSGPSPTLGQACNIAPMVVCGNPAAGAPYYGYSPNEVEVLKIGSGGGNSGPIGPGNFQLIRLGGAGANIVRENMAGSYQGCVASTDTVETQPGNLVGPVAQGLNTRFNSYSGGMSSADYPPDVVTREPNPRLTYDDNTGEVKQGGTTVVTAADVNYDYQDYQADIVAERYNVAPAPNGNGSFLRREMAVPIADCSGLNSGQSQLPVLGFGCFFMLQRAEQRGTESYVYGQFLANCEAGGRPGPAPNAGPGPYIIQLYRDVASPDS